MAGGLRRLAGIAARELRYQSRWFDAVRKSGTCFTCPVCDWSFDSMVTVDGQCSIHDLPVDLHTENADCPRCRSGIRQRFAFAVMRHRAAIDTAAMRIIHFAPDPGIYKSLRRRANIDYLAADLNPGRFIKAERHDITAIGLTDASVDGIVCIHVLEHIADDRLAIAELFRIARPGAWAAIAVPTYGEASFEDPSLDYAGRERMYGTGDHLRLNGTDFAGKLRYAGFAVDVLDIADVPGNFVDRTVTSPHTESDRYLFWCTKAA